MERPDQEINRKRKNNTHEFQVPRFPPPEAENIADEKDKDFLALSLALRPPANKAARLSPAHPEPEQEQQHPHPPPPPPPPPPFTMLQYPTASPRSASHAPASPPLATQFQSFLQQPTASPLSASRGPASPLPLPSSHQQTYPVCMPPMPIARPGPDSSAEPAMQPVYRNDQAAGQPRPMRNRRNPAQEQREGKANETVPAPFPWATTQRATVHSFEYLISRQMLKIKGEVHCKRCGQFEMEFDLKEKFREVGSFILHNKERMHDRAPSVWLNPVLPACKLCHEENCAKPIIPEDKDSINWLFLLLGQLLGCCTLEQLKYFCKHTKNHRTGAKDRVLYLTYLELCKQLDPNGPFER